MNRLVKLLLVALVFSSSLFAKIIEIEKMDDILDEVTPQSIVIFDLDNTIMEASQTLGSDQWFEYRLTQLKKQGLPADEALKRAVQDWEKVNYNGHVNLVEEITPRIIARIQNTGIPTMGLTARPTTFLEKSLDQLQSLEVPLHKHTVSKKSMKLELDDVAFFKKGVLAVGNNNKGKVLVEFLKRLSLHPKRIIFVDDKVKNVTNVDDALATTTIQSFAYRYGAADWKVKAFNPKIADFEFNYFQKYGIVLSDEQAKSMMGH